LTADTGKLLSQFQTLPRSPEGCIQHLQKNSRLQKCHAPGIYILQYCKLCIAELYSNDT
jgi:hypothetical protein